MAGRHQVGDHFLLRRVERQDGVVGRDELRCGPQRIVRPAQLIGRGGRHLRHQRRVDHVAEIDDSGDAALVRLRDQHVEQVIVVVDHLRAQAGQPRLHDLAEPVHEHPQQGRALAGRNLVDPARQAIGARHVPHQVMRRGRVREAVQRTVEVGQRPRQTDPLRACARGAAHRHPLQIRQQPDTAGAPVAQRDLLRGRTALGAQHARHRTCRRLPADMIEGRGLKIDDVGRLGRIADLEQPGLAGCTVQAEILVAFARQQRRVRLDAV